MKKFMMIEFLFVSSFILWAVTSPCTAHEKFPSKPITLLIGYPPGGAGDLPLRYLSESVSKSLGQRVVIIDKVGGGGTVALGGVKTAKPDGYTIDYLPGGPIIGGHIWKLPLRDAGTWIHGRFEKIEFATCAPESPRTSEAY
jgi:tripartite-type tricarboxylate transporter receptor subunit TctC